MRSRIWAGTEDMKTHARIATAFFALAAFLPLIILSGPAQAQQSASSITTPRIDGFDVEPVTKPVAGNELAFTLYGSPGATASVAVGGAQMVSYPAQPGLTVGTRVKVENGVLVPA